MSVQQDIGAEASYPALNLNVVNGKPVMWRSDNLAGGAGTIWRGTALASPTTWTKTATDAPVMSATTTGVYTAGAIYPTGGANPDDLVVAVPHQERPGALVPLLEDPDGHGIEVLYELPREVWGHDIDAAQNFSERLPTEGPEALVDTTDNPVFGRANVSA